MLDYYDCYTIRMLDYYDCYTIKTVLRRIFLHTGQLTSKCGF